MPTEAMSRRKFLRASGMSGTALLLGLYFPSSAKAGKILTGTEAETSAIEMNAWILIDTAGKVTL